MNSRGKLIAVCAVLVVAIGLLVWVVKPKNSPLGGKAGAILTVCAACGHSGTQTLKSVPDTCLSCHQQQVYPAVKCPSCGAANALMSIGGPQGRQPLLTCRACGRPFSPKR